MIREDKLSAYSPLIFSHNTLWETNILITFAQFNKRILL
nr:MAG TPA: hypothetical protein [Crassvirales sp.]